MLISFREKGREWGEKEGMKEERERSCERKNSDRTAA